MLVPDVAVRPVEVRLLRREQMEVPLAVVDARPRRPAEDRLPVVRRQLAVGSRAGPEPETLALGRAGRRRERLAEPRVLARDVVRDDVDDRADPERARLGDQLLGLLQRPEGGIDRAVVGDVVTGVRHRRRVPGVEPEGVDAEIAKVRKPFPHAGEIADAVAVRVAEAPDVDLVDDGVAPPPGVGRRRGLGRSPVVGFGGLRRRRRRSRSRHRGENGIRDNRLQYMNEHLHDFDVVAQLLTMLAHGSALAGVRGRAFSRAVG